MILYHGSYTHFENIDLKKNRKYKDFGQGFYTTKVESQAQQWARNMSARFGALVGYVSIYECDESLFKNFKYLSFNEPTEEWAYFIMNNRNAEFSDFENQLNNHNNQFDIVEGPVANDNIAVVLDQFMMNMKSGTALVEALEYKNLNHQISFHTEKGISLLTKVKHYDVR
ncbi:MAG: DUF3990 domain-containing protein [Treponema sp.]|nr:DUF3990 domain-containing protein [Treponema sp.]